MAKAASRLRHHPQEALAHILGRPINSINQIIKGKKAITPQTARELAAAFGTSAELWMNLESAYRRLDAERQAAPSHRQPRRR